MSPKKPEPPTLWIIAGANGSGKSSAYDRMYLDEPKGAVWIIAHADTAEILDNSDEIPQLVASKSDDIVEIFDELAPELDQAIQRAAAGDLRKSARFLVK